MNRTILIENIKLYNPLQNRGLLLTYVIALDILFIFLPKFNTVPPGPDSIYTVRSMLFFFLSIYLFGAAAVYPQFELMTKPQFLCLPGSQKNMKTVLLITGCFVMLISTLVLMPFSHTGTLIWSLRIITAPVLGLPFFLLAVTLSFFLRIDKPDNRIIKSGLYLIAIFMIAIGLIIGDFSLSITDLVIFWIIPLSISSIALMIALAKILGEFDIIRKYHTGTYIPKLAAALNQDSHLDIIRQKQENRKQRKNLAEKIILKKMEQQPFLSLNRSIYGKIYQMAERKIDFESAAKLSFPIKIVFSICILLISGYFPMENSISFLAKLFCLFMPCLVANGIFNISFNEFLLPGGRSEGFFVSVNILSLKLITGLVYVASIIAMSWLLKNIMPVINLPAQTFQYNPLSPELLIWSALFLSTVNLFAFHMATRKGKNTGLRVTAMTTVIALLIISFEFAILSGTLRMWMVICTFFIITGIDLFLYIRYWFKQDLV